MNRIDAFTRMTAEQHRNLSSVQSRILRDLSDRAPGGRVRYEADLATGELIIEDATPEPPEATE